MSYETATILFRHGRDDFAVWEVDLPEQMLWQAKRSLNTATGDLDFILDQLPIQKDGGINPRCHFLFEDGSTLALFSMKMTAGFYDEYRDVGCSVRGGKADVMAEVEEQLREHAHCWEPAMQMG